MKIHGKKELFEAIDSGCFSDEYAEWVYRQIDGSGASTLNNPRFKKIIDKPWGLSAEGFQYHSYDNCEKCGVEGAT